MRSVLSFSCHVVVKESNTLFVALTLMSRLASFRGPSTPTASPARQTTPSSPSRLKESTFHRKTRSLLLELRSITETWDDLILIDGLKAIRSLVDLRTDLQYATLISS
jgi:hypothetical protein